MTVVAASVLWGATVCPPATTSRGRRPPAGSDKRPRPRSRGWLAVQASTRTIQLEGALVVAPERRRPKGIVHFLGGAFAGAVPQLLYSLLVERLAEGGYTVVCTPYAVTFRHIECAAAMSSSFESALAQLRGGSAGSSSSGGGGRGAWAVPPGLPVHGVGHSNGALLHLLIGAVCLQGAAAAAASSGSSSSSGSGSPAGTAVAAATAAAAAAAGAATPRASNVIISYNNRQVADAVPVPLGPLGGAVQQLRGQGRLAAAAAAGLSQAAAAAQQLLELSGEAAAVSAGPVAAASWRQQQQALLGGLQQLDPALIQLGSVFDEVGDGFVDFVPNPAYTRQLVGGRYCVPSTLLVAFENDSIDQSPEAAAMLSQQGSSGSVGGSRSPARRVSSLVLPGSHVTPCGGDPPGWPGPRAGGAYGPADALAQAARAVLQADTNRLADRVLEFLDAQPAAAAAV